MRVLVAIDGSEPSVTALDLVAGIAWPQGTLVRVVEAIDHAATPLGGPWPALAPPEADLIEADIRAFAERNVFDGRGRIERDGLTVETAVVFGRAATVIVDAGRRRWRPT